MLVLILIAAVLALIFLVVWREWKYQKEKIALRSAKLKTKAAQEKIKAMEKDLEEAISMSEIDPLTKACNRRGLNRQAEIAIAQANRHERSVALVYIDLDGFKDINDSHGHHIGDRVLRQLAKMLINETRESDIVARLGGDEMAILMPETEKLFAVETAERIKLAVASYEFPANGHPVKFTVSIGVASYPGSAADIEELVFKADTAMYASKRKGKDCVSEATSLDSL